MDLSVIENDPKEVKKYLQNFVPINYYRVLDDAYLYQIRAVLLHSVSHAELYNPVYAGLINDLTVTSGKNYATINTKLEVITDNFSALAIKTESVRVEAANANASIVEIQQASVEQNKAQASVNQRLEASLDDIVVGGRNIMKNSDFSKGYRAWQEASITKHNHFIGTMHKISSTGIIGSLMGIYPLAEYQNMAMVEGTEYSISFYAYGSILLMDEIYLTCASEAPIKLPSVVISTDLSERRHITFKAPTGGGGLGLIFGATATSEDDWFSISRIKVELGNKPSDWTPAPEDVEGYINEVQSSIDTFKNVQVERNLATAQTIEQIDTRVKGNAASILEEKNTRVDQFSALSQVNTELLSKTNENEAAIKTIDMTFTDRYNANVSRLAELEADNSLGKGKIVNLEKVTTSLGEVVVSQGSTLNAKINNLAMGGRNLLRNSDFKLGVDTWGTSAITYAKSIVGNLTTVTNTGTTTDYFGLTPVNIFKTVTLIKDKEYVLSFYAKGNIPSINDIWITTEGELPQQLDSVAITDGISDRYSIVFIANHTTEVGSIIIGASGYAKDKWFAVAAVKLEIGNKATDWTEAPEDSKAFIHDVEANINEFKEVQVNYNEATTTAINTMESTLGENSAKIIENYNTLASEDEAITNLYTSLSADYGLNKTKVSNDIKAVADDVSASIESISTLRTEFDTNKTGVDSFISSQANVNIAQTERMDSLYADIGDNSAAIASEELARTSAVEAVANTVTALDTRFEGNKTSVTNALTVLADKDTSLANSITALTTTVGNNTTAISTESTARSTADTAIGNRITTVEGKTDNALARVATVETIAADNKSSIASTKTELTAAYKQAIDDIEIGGRNLVLDTAIMRTELGTASANITNSDGILTLVSNGSELWRGSPSIEVKAGVSYTASIRAKADNLDIGLSMPLYYDDFWHSPYKTYAKDTSGEWITISETFIPHTDSSMRIAIHNHKNTTGIAYYKQVKIEKGNKATAWTAAPEDIEADYTAKISTEATARANAVQSVVNTVTALDTDYKGNKTAVNNSLTALSNADTAIINDVNNLKVKTDNTNAEINRVNNLVSDNKQSIAQTKTDITAEYKAAINDVTVNRNLFIVSKVGRYLGIDIYPKYGSIVVEGNTIKVLSNPVDIIGAPINNFKGNTLTISGKTNLSNIQSYYRFNTQDYNTSLSVTVVNGKFTFSINIPSGATSLNLGLGIYPFNTPYQISEVKVESGLIATEWTVAPEDALDFGTGNKAAITSEATTRASEDGALSTRINTVKATADNAQARVGTVESAVATNTGAIASTRTDVTAILDKGIEGRNLLRHGTFPTQSVFNSSHWNSNCSTKDAAYDDVFGSTSAIKLAVNHSNSYLLTTEKLFETTGLHTVSFWVKSNYNGRINVSLGAQGVSNYIPVSTTWTKQTVTANITDINVHYKLVFGGWDSWTDTGLQVYLSHIKVEKGNVATAWTAAPTDASATVSIEATARAIETMGLYAQYTVKLDVGGRVSGFGLASSSKSSEFAVVADNFYIALPGTSGIGTKPFRVENGIIYMNEAVIKDTSITTAKIANLAVTSGKIGDLAVTTAKIDNLAVKSAQIDNLAVKSANINNLAVTTGKIANLAVDTLQIAGNAVTVPVAVYTEGSIGMNTGYLTEVQRMTIPNIEGNKAVAISFNYTANGTDQSSSTAYVNIALNGTVIRSGMVARTNTTSGGAYSTNLLLSPTESGVLTVSVIYSGNSRTGDISSRFISMVLTKR